MFNLQIWIRSSRRRRPGRGSIAPRSESAAGVGSVAARAAGYLCRAHIGLGCDIGFAQYLPFIMTFYMTPSANGTA